MRTIIDLTDEQRDWLEQECRREGISRAEAIRRLVDDAREMDQKAELREALKAASGSWTSSEDAVDYQRRIRAEWDRDWDAD
jgi:hypothetical protein